MVTGEKLKLCGFRPGSIFKDSPDGEPNVEISKGLGRKMPKSAKKPGKF